MTGKVDALALFGTAEPVPERRQLKAGPLTAILEEGNLRTISFGGMEVVRAVNYLARDSSWGTYKSELSNPKVEERNGAFTVSYDGLCAGPDGRYAYRMTMKGESVGRLVIEAMGEALTDFVTNRTGFVVLHPAEVAGRRLAIRHSDGTVEETRFPHAISPDQPAFDIAALIHEPARGLTCSVEMAGDAFEMEDQRNWADASFKTYVRPLSKPRPYVIPEGEKDLQRITITVDGRHPLGGAAAASGATLTLGGPKGHMPGISLFLDPDQALGGMASAPLLGITEQVIVRLDPANCGPDTLGAAAEFARAIGAGLAVEAIFDALNPTSEAAAVAEAIRAARIEPTALLISPSREFKSRLSNSLPDGQATITALVDAMRATGIEAPVGAGTPSFFTELNRNPPLGNYDFAFFSVASNVHAADDISVMETLSVYPAIISSARTLCAEKPIWLGPCTIGMRHNPYGAAVADNPEGRRKAGSRSDPRHGAIFGATFAAGVAAAAANAGVDHLILAAPTGPFGLLDDALRPRPIRQVHELLARAADATRADVAVDHSGVSVFGFYEEAGLCVVIANVSCEEIEIRLPARPAMIAFVAGAENLMPTGSKAQLQLPPYRTAVLRFATKP